MCIRDSAGTAATAAGPHAGGQDGERIHRLDFKGGGTLDWAIHQHARIAAAMGIASVAVWLLLRRRDSDPQVRKAVTALVALLALQGAIGALQYATHLPAEIVWVHVTLAALTWLSVLWSTAAAGRLVPRAAAEPADRLLVETATPVRR